MSAGFTLIDAQIEHHAFGMLDWSTCASVERVAERASGAWVFKGTRLPVSIPGFAVFLKKNTKCNSSVDFAL
jgi:hypothetical protein